MYRSARILTDWHLVMNICDFAYGSANYTVPLSRIEACLQRAAHGGEHGAVVCAMDPGGGTMRGLFSMLFGAGVILLLARGEARCRFARGAQHVAGAV